MWCWRRMLRIPWTARRTNASILRQLKITSRLSTTCLKRILEYFGHIARRDGDNLEKIVVTGKVEGKRPRGRSPIRWSDQIRTALDTKVALNVAQSRVKWHKIVQKVVSGRGHDPQQ
ncbi:jg14603 [Pararge aegeria aegeria]|uniref:Jg14603 protein n=1 Tax=Pararge aegeria aegeria TaxID=348720 RepID=A0A8S4R1V4_9NEOP|nr:jg14603 [Pararge aegeria aegeria]